MNLKALAVLLAGIRRAEGFKDSCAVHKDGPAVVVTFSGGINDVLPGVKR